MGESKEEIEGAKKPGQGFVKQNAIAVAVATLFVGILIGAGIGVAFMQLPAEECPTCELQQPIGMASLAASEVASKVQSYVNENLLSQGFSASGTAVDKFNDSLYQANFVVGDGEQEQEASVFVTLDGRMMFIGAENVNMFDMDAELPGLEPVAEETLSCDEVPKQEEAVFEAFVVSYCPFGLQAQRALIPVARLLGMDAVQIKYIGDVVDGKVTAMHGEEEATENHRQICIREEQSNKFLDYLSCFIREGDTDGCLASEGIDIDELDACMSDSERGLAYAAEDFAVADYYGVTGSPTFALNGGVVSEFDFAAAAGNLGIDKARSPENFKQLICCGFSTAPGECSTVLSDSTAATGFSTEETGTGSGSC